MTHYIICYDIADCKRLRRVHSVVSDVAMPVQLSVFEAEMAETELTKLIQSLSKQIN